MEGHVFLFFFLILVAQSIDGKKSKCPGCNPAKTGIWVRRQMALGRQFKDTKDECEHRVAFEKNLGFVNAFSKKARKNPDVYTWQIGENGLADKTDSEFKAMLGMKAVTELKSNSSRTFPDTWASSNSSKDHMIVDYTAEGYVTPVDDQGRCASCWAFCTTGAMEAQIAMHQNNLPNLSEQHLLDCSNETYNTSGCDGGLMTGAFQFVIDNGGIVTGDAYPNTGSTGDCEPPNGTRRYTCKTYHVVKQTENALLSALVRYGPIACGIDGSLRSFQLYTNGIFSDRQCSTDLNHAVLIVGAGTTEDGIDYWLIKNSWGTSWGEYGFCRLLRGYNLCNIVGDCSYPCFCE